ncbi:hypothetical protein CYMTET_12527 [Cymbomonas tetramitiformis]|uniref:Uncharacterized protein n=1 Tax=Cymbomonas tetramitiformis TaxID=36881 RepID=A0AAE0GKA9_9CHLO|nr:hypothetical protein CYMTET_12527 [Cymbomonas tetramitiformis]
MLWVSPCRAAAPRVRSCELKITLQNQRKQPRHLPQSTAQFSRTRIFSNSSRWHQRERTTPTQACEGNDEKVVTDLEGAKQIEQALEAARSNLAAGVSPGAGLSTAEEQADAAYADLINTSLDVYEQSMSDDDMEQLSVGGMMEETEKKRKSKGLLDDVANLFGALSKGAHIVRKDDGRI